MFDIKSGCHKVAPYADNLLFFVTSPETTITNLIELNKYSKISGYKINLRKSKVLNGNIPTIRGKYISASFIF